VKKLSFKFAVFATARKHHDEKNDAGEWVHTIYWNLSMPMTYYNKDHNYNLSYNNYCTSK